MEKEGPTRISRGCFFCKSGKEADVINHFITTFPNGEAISPTRTRIRRVHDTAIEECVPLLPGYVFFQITEKEPEAPGIMPFKKLTKKYVPLSKKQIIKKALLKTPLGKVLGGGNMNWQNYSLLFVLKNERNHREGKVRKPCLQ